VVRGQRASAASDEFLRIVEHIHVGTDVRHRFPARQRFQRWSG
jgi:hypothetical protein